MYALSRFLAWFVVGPFVPRLASLLLLALLAWGGVPSPVHARVDDQLRQLYDQFTLQQNQAGAYQSQARGYFSGGDLQIRVPMQSMTPVTIDPPGLGYGCNGIDLHFGGLSYISLDRFIQLLTQMGTSAVQGYAWHLAMEVLCPTCNSMLKHLNTLAQQVNNFANVSPCRIGTMVGKALAGDPKSQDKLTEELQRRRTELGQIGDTLQDMGSTLGTGMRNAVNMLKGTERDVTGDFMELALEDSAYDADAKVFLKSLIGTVVVNEAGVPKEVGPTLEFEELVTTIEGNPVTLLQCSDPPTCQQQSRVTTTQFKGLKQRVVEALTTLKQNLQANQPVSVAVKNLVGKIPSPVYRIFLISRGSPELVTDELMDEVATEAAYWLARQYIWNVKRDINDFWGNVRAKRPNWAGTWEHVKTLKARLETLSQQADAAWYAHRAKLPPELRAKLQVRGPATQITVR